MTGPRVERRLAAILAADVAGYSRLMGVDEVATLQALKAHRREVVDPAIAAHHGRIVKTTGDGMLVEFGSVVDAVTCAMSVQKSMADRNNTSIDPANSDSIPQIVFRVGINVGDIIIDGDDIFGDGVNVAARVEAECEPGGVYLSANAFEQMRSKTPFTFDDMGERHLKNIDRPIRVYSVRAVEPKIAAENNIEASASSLLDTGKPLRLPTKPSIAVLPFQNMSGDPEQEYFADGMVEDIITELSRFKGLLVIARNSTFTYKGKAVDIKKVGRELSVKYVLEGSVRRSGQRVRVTAQLINAETGGHVWAEHYDRELLDIFEVQDEITRSVVATIQTELISLEGSLVDRSTSPNFELWSAGKKVWQQFYGLTKEKLLEARRLAKDMAQAFPGSAEGHKLDSLVTSHCVFMGFSSEPDVWKDEADKSIRRALSLSTTDEHIYWGLGIVLGILRDEYEPAIMALERSIQINPNFALGYGTYGTVLAYAGRAHESIARTEYAMRLNPKDPSLFFRYSVLSIAYFLLSEYEQALKFARLSMERSDFWIPHAIFAGSSK